MSKTSTRFDTGITGKNTNRYQQIKRAIINGKIRPSVYALKKHWHCSQQTSTRYLDAMESTGLLIRNARGHRLLSTLNEAKTDV